MNPYASLDLPPEEETVTEEPGLSDAASSIAVERGRPRPFIDGVGWTLGLPAKLVFWDRRVDNHDVSPETESQALEFLAAHNVDDVLVRVNQYDPLGEWRRLRENDAHAAPWRYTVGSLYTLGYTLAPGRLFGGDWYNPFTNSMHLYSDIPAVAMEQAAYAHEVQSRATPSVYASAHALPFVGLLHESTKRDDVYQYVDENGDLEARKEARRVLEPRLGAEIGGDIGAVVPGGGFWALGGAMFGHFTGGVRAQALQEPAGN